MGSSLHRWESDPLFSAAEVVQDSADRMETLYRLLLHEQSLLHDDHSDQGLLTSIEYHWRDLATLLETTKWQLEDFERATCSTGSMAKHHTNEDVNPRHKQFIGAVKEQINNVEESIKEQSMQESLKRYEGVNLNEQDRDGLALFLSGKSLTKYTNHHELEETNILRKFFDPSTASSSKDDGIIHQVSKEIPKSSVNGAVPDGYYDSAIESNQRKGGSHFSTDLNLFSSDSLQEISYDREVDRGRRDLEGNEALPESSFHKIKWRGFYSRMNASGFFNNLWSVYGSRVSRNYTKQMKDGEQRRHSPSYLDHSHTLEGQRLGIILGSRDSIFKGLSTRFFKQVKFFCSRLGSCKARYHNFGCCVRSRRSLKMILTSVLTLVLLGLVVSRIT